MHYVRYSPESGHVQCTRLCLLWAKSGHLKLLATKAEVALSSSSRPLSKLHDLGFCIGAFRAFKNPLVVTVLVRWLNVRKQHRQSAGRASALADWRWSYAEVPGVPPRATSVSREASNHRNCAPSSEFFYRAGVAPFTWPPTPSPRSQRAAPCNRVGGPFFWPLLREAVVLNRTGTDRALLIVSNCTRCNTAMP